MHSQGPSSSPQFDLSALSDITEESSVQFDPRNRYRIFCSKEHQIPNIKSLTVFGSPPFPLTEEVRNSQSQQGLNLHIPEYLIMPSLFEEARCPLAAVYTDFRDWGRRRLTEGAPIEAVLGTSRVELTLYFRQRRPEDPHTPNTWACEYMRLLKDFDFYVSLACIFTHTHFMRVSTVAWV